MPVIRAVNSEAVKNCDLNNRDIACGIDTAGIGKNTINKVNLNDIDRVMVPRMQEWEGHAERSC